MADESVTNYKEGFLQKAGKHSFQAWRKRWFVLNNDDLKYYNPGPEYDENNLLGVIQLAEIRSLVSTKTPKHAFDIVSRTRTYNVSAKSDLERDDWIIALRKASDEKRNADVQPRQSLASYSDLPEKIEKGKKEKSKKKSKKATLKLGRHSNHDDNSLSKLTEDQNSDDSAFTNEKTRANTLMSSTNEKVESPKRRSLSMADSLTRANSMLRHMSVDEDSTEAMYQQLENTLEEEESSDDESEDHVPHSLSIIEYELPPPREGETYAFDEIEKLLQPIDKEDVLNIDLGEFATTYGLSFDKSEEFLATSLLRKYLKINS